MSIPQDIKDKVEEYVEGVTKDRSYKEEIVRKASLTNGTLTPMAPGEIESRLLELVDDPYFHQINLPLWFCAKYPQYYNTIRETDGLIQLQYTIQYTENRH